MVRIPDEYQEVEYIESTGTQYIDLDFGFDPTDEIETRFSITDTRYEDRYIVSPVEWNTNNNRFAMGVNTYFAVGYGNATTNTTRFSPNMNNDGSIHEWHYSNRLFEIVDLGRSKKVSTINFGSTTANLRLFYGYNTNTSGKIASYHHKKEDGTEVNLIPCYRKSDDKPGMYDTVTKTFFTNQGTGTFLKGNDVTYDTVNLMESRRRILLNTPHLESLTGSALSFKTDIVSKLKECKIHFTPIQEGTGDPSPDNVRPISGWDGVTVTRCGKNLFDVSGAYLSNKWVNNDGEIVNSLSSRPTSLYTQHINVASGTTYRVSGASKNIQYIRIVYYDADDNFLGRKVTNGAPNPGMTFTPPTGTSYILVNPDVVIQNIQVEVGSTVTTFESFQSTTLTIPFPQTIYGGYVDLVKGEVVETILGITANSEDASLNAVKNTNVWGQLSLSQFAAPSSDIVLSNIFKGGHYSTSWNARAGATGNRIIFGIPLEYNTTAKIKNFFEDNQTQFAYQLQTPTTYSLDPVTIRTLKGLNNIWSDANGNIELKFWTH